MVIAALLVSMIAIADTQAVIAQKDDSKVFRVGGRQLHAAAGTALRSKIAASKANKIPTDRMSISATYTHSAQATMGCWGVVRDVRCAKFLPARIARGIQLAQDNLELARIDWAKSRDPKTYTTAAG